VLAYHSYVYVRLYKYYVISSIVQNLQFWHFIITIIVLYLFYSILDFDWEYFTSKFDTFPDLSSVASQLWPRGDSFMILIYLKITSIGLKYYPMELACEWSLSLFVVAFFYEHRNIKHRMFEVKVVQMFGTAWNKAF